MSTSIGHSLTDGRIRSNDVKQTEAADFSALLLSQPVLAGLARAGFDRPSPIQLKAIPLGKTGLDLLIQAKAGTGKTLVFATIALESIDVSKKEIQVLVVAPTRELAAQIHQVVTAVGVAMPGLSVFLCIGGLHEKKDAVRSQIVVATPGRVIAMMQAKTISTSSIHLLVLDEADKLLLGAFADQLQGIVKRLPAKRQVLACSATMTDTVARTLGTFMQDPMKLMLDAPMPALQGVSQFYVQVNDKGLMAHEVWDKKIELLLQVFSKRSFDQCILFCNHRGLAESTSNILSSNGFPAAYIAGDLDQVRRLAVMNLFRTYQVRCLISTDLSARGIDVDKVDLVVCFDMPPDAETHMHRIGRAGRFGALGESIVFANSKELSTLQEVCTFYHTSCTPLEGITDTISAPPARKTVKPIDEPVLSEPRVEEEDSNEMDSDNDDLSDAQAEQNIEFESDAGEEVPAAEARVTTNSLELWMHWHSRRLELTERRAKRYLETFPYYR